MGKGKGETVDVSLQVRIHWSFWLDAVFTFGLAWTNMG
jgi:hypothetical protein